MSEQNSIEKMTSEELALLLGEQYKMVMQCQNNIAVISNVLNQRKAKLATMKKGTSDGKQGDRKTCRTNIDKNI